MSSFHTEGAEPGVRGLCKLVEQDPAGVGGVACSSSSTVQRGK